MADLANKTRAMVQESATQEGLKYSPKSLPFDERTIKALQDESGSDEAKVFNLVRGLWTEIDNNRDMAPVLQTLKERADRILEELQDRGHV